MAELLGSEFVRAGHEVEVIATNTGAATSAAFLFPVHYRPSTAQMLRIVGRSDCVLQMNVGLRTIWPALMWRKPFVVSHQTMFDYVDRDRSNWDRFKISVARRGINVAASRAVAAQVGEPVEVIHNSYEPQVFHADLPAAARCGVVFAGRLVSEKGVETLLAAVAKMRHDEARRITIAGDGPERAALERRAQELDLGERVSFVGRKSRSELAQLFREHEIVVVPSRYREAFGIVALEAAACGCDLVVADGGGLAEAAGPCGRSFPRGDSDALRERLREVLAVTSRGHSICSPEERAEHLAAHAPDKIADAYLAVLRRSLTR